MDQIDDVTEVTVMDLDLNQEPLDSSTGSGSGSRSRLGSILNELEIAHGQIEERIRQLEAVTERARERQRWRQARNPPETVDVMVETTSHNALIENPIQNMEVRDEMNDRHKNWLKDSSSELVAKALNMDMNLANAVGDGGGFFDCNICLEMAREPILTCCGHLFCWACFYQLPCDAYSSTKECPVCKGEVTDASITPIYGNGNVVHVPELESGLKVPPRPRARRVESVRQQRVNRRFSHVPVAEALRRIRMGMGISRDRPLRHNTEVGSREVVPSPTEVSPLEVVPNPTEVGGRQGLRSRQFSNVLSESADSLLSISSALNNAERLVDDLESYIHNRVGGSRHEQVLSFGGNLDDPLVSSTDVTIIPSQEQLTGESSSIVGNSSVAVASSSSRGRRLSMLHYEHQSHDPSASEMNVAENRPSSSSRRRLRLSRVSDADQPFSRESQRRRLG